MQIAQGNVYTSTPPDSSGTASVPLVTGSFTLGEFRISVDKVKGSGVQIEFTLAYNLTWNDTRLATSPCRRVFDTMLSAIAIASANDRVQSSAITAMVDVSPVTGPFTGPCGHSPPSLARAAFLHDACLSSPGRRHEQSASIFPGHQLH